jgi:hypothetical protein
LGKANLTGIGGVPWQEAQPVSKGPLIEALIDVDDILRAEDPGCLFECQGVDDLAIAGVGMIVQCLIERTLCMGQIEDIPGADFRCSQSVGDDSTGFLPGSDRFLCPRDVEIAIAGQRETFQLNSRY